MELTRLPGVTVDYAGTLSAAGILTVGDMALAEDLAALAAASGIHAETLEAFRAAARRELEAALEAAGVAGPDALAAADINDLATRTGISADVLGRFRWLAGGPAAIPRDRVVLSEGAATALVHFAGDTFDRVPIITARLEEDAEALLARAGTDGVLLQERATAAPVRLRGEARGALPIFKARPEGEQRVRVKSIRVKPEQAAAKKGSGGVFGRFRKSPP